MKFVPILFIFSLSVLNTYGQRSSFELGLIFNANGIHVEGENNLYWTSTNGSIWGGGGLSYGLFITRDFQNNIVGALEIRYSRKGGNFEYLNSYGMQEFEVLKLKYIEIPVLIGYHLKTSKRKYLLETGVSYSKLVNANVLFNDFSVRPTKPNAEELRDQDLSWIASIKLYLGENRNFLFGFRFTYSILSIHEYYTLKNMTYGIELNYLLFKRK